MHAKNCDINHDECRNTKKFKYVGQNIAHYSSHKIFLSPEDMIKASVIGWYKEKLNATPEDLEQYKDPSKIIGHFTQVINDLANEIGCAAVIFKTSLKQSVMVCNYSRSNVYGHRTYASGKPASKCETGINKMYPALCSEKEKIDLNKLYF